MQAVIYCRVSSAEQVDNTSLATQEAACREYCEKNGMSVASVFVDRGESAKTADRPEFLRMVAECQRRKDIGRVVVYRVDRFARNTLDHVVYAQRLRKSGATLASVTEAITEGPGGDFIQNIYAAVAQFDNDVRSARATDAMRAIRARGGWVHRAPIGFKIVRRGDGIPVLGIDEQVAAMIRRSFELVAGGRSMKSVYDDLRPAMSRTTFYRIFSSPLYAQIAPRQFAEVNKEMPTQRRTARGEDFPLRGVIICGCCGRQATASYAKSRYPYYHCKTPGHARISSEKLDLAIRGLLADLSGAFLIAWPGIKEFMIRGAAEKIADNQAREIEIDSKLSRLSAQLDRLVTAMLDGKLPDGHYDRRRSEIEGEMARLKAERETLDGSDNDSAEMIDMAGRVIGDLAMIWNGVSPQVRLNLIRQLFPRGIKIENQTVRTSVTDSIFGILGASDTGHFRMATPTGWWSNLVAVIKMAA
jgi:site-specific DNA recombinase